MSQSFLLVIIVVALAGAAYLLFLHRRTSAISAKVAALPALLGTAIGDIKAHVTKEAERTMTRTATVGTVIVDKLGGEKAAKPIPVVATTAEPAPAAPAPTEAVAPPPATVAPAAPPAAPAPSSEGSGTEHSLTIPPRAPIPDSTGPVPVASLSLTDLRFLWWATINPATPKMHNWEYTVLSGTRVQIQEDLSTAGLNLSWLRGFQPDAYHGILRNYYDDALKA